MLLGAGELGKEVIIACNVWASKLSRWTATQRPGHQVAHRAHVIDMSNGKALRALIEAEKPHLVVQKSRPSHRTLLEIEAAGWQRSFPPQRHNLTMNARASDGWLRNAQAADFTLCICRQPR